MSDHHRKLERMYLAAPCNAYYEPRIEIADAGAVVEIDVRPRFFHAADAVHGSVYFKLLDDASYFAANSRVEDVLLLTVSFDVHLIRPVSRGVLRSEGRIVEATRTTTFAEATLSDGDGRLLGTGKGVFARSRIPLSPEVRYENRPAGP